MKLLAALLLLTALAPVRISVSKQALMAGDTLDVVCYVRPEKSNEWLQIGVENDHVSVEPLDGDKAPIPFFKHYGFISCDAGYAYCAIGHGTTTTDVSKVHLVIGGCGRDER